MCVCGCEESTARGDIQQVPVMIEASGCTAGRPASRPGCGGGGGGGGIDPLGITGEGGTCPRGLSKSDSGVKRGKMQLQANLTF